MADRFEVFNNEYPLPESFRMGDPVLVEEVTGLSWGEFSDRLEDTDGDPAVMLGMLAVAVWQQNPRWRRDRVARFVEAIRIEDVKFVGEEKEPGDVRPPAGNGSRADDGSSSESRPPAGSSSDTTRPSTTPDGLPLISPVSA